MDRFLLAAALVVVAVVVAWIVRRRTRPDEPAQGRNWPVPAQLHRPDFVRPEAPWLVVVFSSATCNSCAGAWATVEPLESPVVAVQNVLWQERRDLHDRYRIEAAPTVLVADRSGVVRAGFVGEPTAADLAAKMAELRESEPTPTRPDDPFATLPPASD